jgi:hypothetical protein
MEQDRFDLIDQEQLAAQVVAVMDSHFQRPTAEQKQHVLKLAETQIRATCASLPPTGPLRSETQP